MKIACNSINRIFFYELGFRFGYQPNTQNGDIYKQPKVILYFELDLIFWEYYLEIHFGYKE